jgi:hypothetical protein
MKNSGRNPGSRALRARPPARLGAARADSSGMDWLGVFYVWGADIGADYRDTSIDASFSDIVDKLDMGFMGHVEAQGDDFGGFADLVYMSVSDSRSTKIVRQAPSAFDLLSPLANRGKQHAAALDQSGGFHRLTLLDSRWPGPAQRSSGSRGIPRPP